MAHWRNLIELHSYHNPALTISASNVHNLPNQTKNSRQNERVVNLPLLTQMFLLKLKRNKFTKIYHQNENEINLPNQTEASAKIPSYNFYRTILKIQFVIHAKIGL